MVQGAFALQELSRMCEGCKFLIKPYNTFPLLVAHLCKTELICNKKLKEKR